MPPASAKRRVLIVDDEALIRDMLGQLFEASGFDVCFAADGAQALVQAASVSARPDIVILDLMLPKIHGLEVLRRLKADPATKPIPVVIHSAKDFETEQRQAIELGAVRVLSKPVRWNEFLRTLGEVFAVSGPSAPAATAPAGAQGEAYAPRLRVERGSVEFWGTRGSIPVSGQLYAHHGGNTSCLRVSHGEDMVILDAGTGIRPLGEALAAGKPRRIHLFITHTHWDHIQGFPFFLPAYLPGFSLDIYGAHGFGKDLKQVFQGQLDRDYFPAQMEDMRAKIEFHELTEGELRIGDIGVTWDYTHHPGSAVCYKLRMGGATFVYMSDNEFLKGYLGPPDAVPSELLLPYQPLIRFLTGVDVLIAEAQYSNEEYARKIGWGHSSLSNASLLARMAQIRRWLITHHEPRYVDDTLRSNLALTRQLVRDLGQEARVSLAFDGMVEIL